MLKDWYICMNDAKISRILAINMYHISLKYLRKYSCMSHTEAYATFQTHFLTNNAARCSPVQWEVGDPRHLWNHAHSQKITELRFYYQSLPLVSLSGHFGLMLDTLTECSANWRVHARFIHKSKSVNWISKDGILFFGLCAVDYVKNIKYTYNNNKTDDTYAQPIHLKSQNVRKTPVERDYC